MPGISAEIPGRQSKAAFFRPILLETSIAALMLMTPTFGPPVQASHGPRTALCSVRGISRVHEDFYPPSFILYIMARRCTKILRNYWQCP